MAKYSLLVDAGKFAAECEDPHLAEVVLRKALQHADEVFGPHSNISAALLQNLVEFYFAQGADQLSDDLLQRWEQLGNSNQRGS